VTCTSPLYLAKHDITVPCGKCLACKIARSREWATRIVHECSMCERNIFATFTYDDAHLPKYGSLEREEFRRFLKRLNYRIGGHLRYYVAGEYGELFERPHYHALLLGSKKLTVELLEEMWKNGHIDIGDVEYLSGRYVADYVGKGTRKPGTLCEPKFVLFSKGLGRDYALKNREYFTKKLGCTIEGREVGIPRYYVKKLGIPPEVLVEKGKLAAEDTLVRTVHLVGDDPERVRADVVRQLKQKHKNIKARHALKKEMKL